MAGLFHMYDGSSRGKPVKPSVHDIVLSFSKSPFSFKTFLDNLLRDIALM